MINDEEFEKIINECLDELPKEITENLKNVAIVIDDSPSDKQREELKLNHNQSLFGLFEGVPRSSRSDFGVQLPAKITLFKLPLLSAAQDRVEFKERIKRTLWHEIAHYYGLDHEQIDKLQK